MQQRDHACCTGCVNFFGMPRACIPCALLLQAPPKKAKIVEFAPEVTVENDDDIDEDGACCGVILRPVLCALLDKHGKRTCDIAALTNVQPSGSVFDQDQQVE